MIDVALTPAALRPAEVAVVIDVLRATSTIGQALAAGYEAVLCADSIERAWSLRGPGRVLAGERRCVEPPGFQQGNSPRDAAVRRGRELVLATTNGAPAIVAAAGCTPTVMLASVLNLRAVGERLRTMAASSELDLLLVCAGTDGAPALEDTYLAGRLCLMLAGERSDSARIAETVARAHATPLDALAGGAHARTLGAAGLTEDVACCALESRLAAVPQVVTASAGTAVVTADGVPATPGCPPGAPGPALPAPSVATSPRDAAEAILDQGGWCVLEACADVPSQRWDAQLLIFELQAEAVAEIVAQEIDDEPGHDLRLTGCDRRTLSPRPEMGAHLCHLAARERALLALG